MIDKFDYLEPACPLSGGKAFYYPQADAPLGHIPVNRILEKTDSYFGRNDYVSAGKLLVYWRDEAIALKDRHGELTMESELVGFYRKQGNVEMCLTSAARALELVEMLEQGQMASGATIFINCGTAYKAFGMAQKALPLFIQAEAIYRQVLPAGDARFGGLYNNMALTLTDLGNYEEAEKAYRSALSVMEKVPQGEAECAITCINLAYLYEALDRTEQLEQCLRSAWQFLHSDALPHDGYYAFVLEKCAPAFRDFGDLQAYQQLIKESERIYAGS